MSDDRNGVSYSFIRRQLARKGIPQETDSQIKRRIGLGLYYRHKFTGRFPDGTMDPRFEPFYPPQPRGGKAARPAD
jgi:hypothetical protein